MLELDGLDVRYGSVPAVRGLSLEVGEAELVGLIGPNGAGKSTTLHAIMGVVPAAAGDVRLAGPSIRGRAPEAIARAGIALVPEGRRIFGELSVEENLRLGLAARRDERRATRSRRPTSSFRCWPTSALVQRERSRAASSSSSRSAARSSRSRTCCCSTSRRSGSRRRSSTRSSRRWPRSASAASRSCSSSSARSARSRSPTARYVLANGELRMTLTPADADDTEKLIQAYLA